MLEIYKINPSLFKFNDKGIAIVEMKDLLKPIANGKDTMYFGEVPMTKDQDQCMGYIIVKKNNNKLKFDYSHLCDIMCRILSDTKGRDNEKLQKSTCRPPLGRVGPVAGRLRRERRGAHARPARGHDLCEHRCR